MSEKERARSWEDIRQGRVKVVIGTRNAVFAPVRDLGVVIIEQEEGYAYKQEQNPKYHAREAALAIAKIKGGMVILGSASPTVETYYKAMNGDYILKKIERKNTPKISFVDMKTSSGKGMLSGSLVSEIEKALNNEGKVILIVNRRDQQAGREIARHHGRPVVAAFANPRPCVEH